MQLVGDLLFMAQVEAGKLALDLEEVDLEARCSPNAVEAAKPVADDKQVELVDRPRRDALDAGRPVAPRAGPRQPHLERPQVHTRIGGASRFASRTLAGDAVVEVADTGVGIPAEEQDRLFERFFRSSNATEQAIPGTGLGLTIAKTIVERHEGSIEIESAEGKGTTRSRPASARRRGHRGRRGVSPSPSCWSPTTIRTSCC